MAVRLRLADLLAGLSVIADLGFGLPPEEAMRSCLIATELARLRDLSEQEVSDTFYASLLFHIGCTAYSHETAAVFGDELANTRAVAKTNFADPRDVLTRFIPEATREMGSLPRVRAAAFIVIRGQAFGKRYETATCEVARETARRLGLPATVQRALYEAHEQWRGGGGPKGLKGDEIALPSRIARVGIEAARWDDIGGPEMAGAAARVQPVASTIIGDIFTMEERARMQGWLSSVWAIASLVGPLVGGFVVERVHWAWVFWINLPIGPLAIAGVYLFLREPASRKRHSVDYAGAALLAAGVSLLLFALLQGGVAWAWTSTESLGCLVGAAVVIAAFIWQERRAPEPILPLGLFRNRVVSVADAAFVLSGTMSPTVVTFISLYVQGVVGASATVAGLSLIPMSIGWPLASAFAGRVILAIGFRRTGLLGAALAVVGVALLVVGASAGTGFGSVAWICVAILVLGPASGS